MLVSDLLREIRVVVGIGTDYVNSLSGVASCG